MQRRDFIRVAAGAGAGLTLAVMLDGCRPEAAPEAPSGAFAPNAWLRIAPDGSVTVMVDRSEMGQGISTALAMLVAEELDADWSQVRYQFAPANEAYFNPAMKVQATGGSTGVRAAWGPLREASAAARAMLVAAAARSWNVSPGECTTESGRVIHAGSGRSIGFGDLADAAGREAVPESVVVKKPDAFRLIGKPIVRLDLLDKVTGRAEFGLDAGPRDAWVAVVARSPVFGGTVAGHDPASALAVPGVRQVVVIESGVAVVADSFWAARAGREALKVTWNDGPGAALDDAGISAAFDALLREDGRQAKRVGDPASVAPARLVEATYDVPYLAHATMEPMNCTADVRDDGVTVWAPTQFQAAPRYLAGGGSRGVAASVAGVGVDRVDIHTTHLGGGFGRRSELDFVREAVEVSKAVKRPVRLVWTREDDIRHDHYRPAARHRIAAGIDQAGRPVVWRHHVAAPSIMAKFIPGFVPDWMAHLAGPLKGGIDPSAVEGVADLAYPVPNLEVRYHEAKFPVPVGYWRSVGHTHTAFAVECFIDELAEAAGRDPVEYRRELLAERPRHRAVLDLAAERAGWGGPVPEGRARGVAVHESFGSYVAEVAEVGLVDGKVRVHRIVCAVDCGQVVNPDTVVAQIEGAVVYGLTAALMGRVTIDRGRVKESNFHDYPVLRMREMPVVEVHLVASPFEPGGVGEPGTPPVAPAVANAVSRLVGRRIRSLPIAVGATS
ncbi:MAG: xanthine dehydrogenase family protein molybdopterin-binding subunit [Gemmatimonadales bacterium]|nr:xanthine dehydrogenase family protein molybdopterin-binding subunit [Gemmatimonadales bacterium]